MALKDITITGSIGSYPTLSYGQKTYISSTDEQSFPIEQFTGSSGGATPNFNGQYSTTDLFVNVTQSWNGSIDTQVGIVDFTHNTQEEFINGEYSGSGIEVTHQRLIGEDCIQLLNVSTVPVNYKPYFYVASTTASITIDPIYETIQNNFLNANTSPNLGEVYLLSIKYPKISLGGSKQTNIRKVIRIKVNKFDEQGNDNTLSLQGLNSLRILFSDLGAIDFPVLSITEYSTYYLYSTDTTLPGNNTVKSVDNNVLDYSFSASLSSISVAPNSGWSGSGLVSSIDNRSYFNPSIYTYTYGDTPNIPIQFTGSINLASSMIGAIVLRNTLTNDVIAGSVNAFSPGIYVFSSSFYPIENNTYGLYIFSDFSTPSTVTISDIQWKFTQSIAPSSSSNITVLEPYLTENFEYSDCNVLFNNATNLEYDPNFYKVNYDTGLLIPTNQQEILDGIAEFAPVKPYNYSLNAQILPRYIGTRYSSDGVNNPSTTNVKFELSFDKINYGTFTNENSAPVRSLKTALAYIDWWGGWPPEKMNASGAHIKYIIDENGETVTPNVTNYSLYTNQGTFVSNETVDVASINQTTPTNSTRNIFRGATRIEPILYNQIRHYEDGPMTFTGSIRFTDRNPLSVDTVKDYTLTLKPDFYYLIPNNPEPNSGINNNVIVAKGADIAGETGSLNNRYTVTQNVIDEHVDLILTANMKITSLAGSNFQKASIGGAFLTNTGMLENSVTYMSITRGQEYKDFIFTYTVPKEELYVGQTFSIGLNVQGMIPGATSISYQIVDSPPVTSVYYESNSSFNISTNPLPTPPIIVSGSSNLFYTSSFPSSGSYLFVTNSAIINYYDSENIYQEDISGSLFNKISLPLSFKVGDEFRFSGNEDRVYMVNEVQGNAYFQYNPSNPAVSASAIQIKLDKQISGSYIDVNQFLVRRYIDDASMILLDDFQPEGSNGPYILKPEFVSPQLNSNIDTYIKNLTEKGLL